MPPLNKLGAMLLMPKPLQPKSLPSLNSEFEVSRKKPALLKLGASSPLGMSITTQRCKHHTALDGLEGHWS